MQGVLSTVYCHVFVARQHGFPNIMRNMVVSCGIMPKGIERLRDAIFDVACQVKENTGNVNVTLQALLPIGDGSSTSLLVLTLSTFFEVLDGAFKH